MSDELLDCSVYLPDPDAGTSFAGRIADMLAPGDVVLLSGDIGTGKSHLARGIIQARLAALDLFEDVPSPTFTLVQTYCVGTTEIWHADLYRLAGPADVSETGLFEAFDTAICLVEWPDRLAQEAPRDALCLHLATDGDGRRLRASGPGRWVDPVKAAIDG